MKLKTKLLFALLVVLAIICVCGTAKATDEVVTEEYVQNILDAVPDSMELDIPEIEYIKSEALIQEQLDEIFESKQIDTSKINMNIRPIRIIYSIDRDGFHTASVSIRYQSVDGTEYTDKDINIKFNNSDNYNSADEQMVKNLDIEPAGYYEVDYNNNNNNLEDMLRAAGKYYTNLVNDSSIVIKAEAGAADKPLLNCITGEGGTSIGIFKNGVFYERRILGKETSIPSITIPSNVSDEEINDYIIDVITPVYKAFVERLESGITFNKNNFKITKGDTYDFITYVYNEDGTANEKKRVLNIPNCYTISYTGLSFNCGLTVKREQPTTVTTTDKTTNVKLDTTTAVVPADTQLVVKEVTTGSEYNTVVSSLGNEVNNFVTYDITLQSNGVEIQPNGSVRISLPIPDNFDKTSLVVYRVDENGTKTQYDVTVDGNYATFETDHFSTYVLAEKAVVDTNSNELDDTPKTGVETNGTLALVITTVLSLAGVVTLKKF